MYVQGGRLHQPGLLFTERLCPGVKNTGGRMAASCVENDFQHGGMINASGTFYHIRG
jgi:hypothetical protein